MALVAYAWSLEGLGPTGVFGGSVNSTSSFGGLPGTLLV